MAEAEPVAAGDEERETMFIYASTATFAGSRHQPCRFMTAQCPNDCGHATTVYQFSLEALTVTGNPDSKNAKWVTPVAEGTDLLVGEADFHEWLSVAKGLSEGNKVQLEWKHDYVTVGGSSGPDRPVTKLDLV